MAQITLTNADIAFDCSDDTVLRAALRQGIGFAYECNVGSCGTCRFELLEGEVVHDRADAPGWTERHRQRKQYLGCQARPLTDCRIKAILRDHYKSRHKPVRTEARLFETEDLTHDIREFRFRLADAAPFLAGQYALLYVPGVTGARAYSMCNVTDDGAEWHFQIKRAPGGAATAQLFDTLAVGDAIRVDGPYGMAYLREDVPRDVLCFAGGSGLSPMISIARAVRQERAARRPHAAFHLWRARRARHLRRAHAAKPARLRHAHLLSPGGVGARRAIPRLHGAAASVSCTRSPRRCTARSCPVSRSTSPARRPWLRPCRRCSTR